MKEKSIFKKILLRIGLTILILLISIIGFGVWISPKQMDFASPYHPFTSEQAKETYLKLYDERAKNWPVESTTKMVETSYGKTFVRISGPESAPPLVLMHGIGGNSLQWISNVEPLSRHFRVYAVDNIYDNGRSIPYRPMTSADDYVDWLNELYNALGLHNQVNMVGLSYGGWITTQYALRFPDRLNKIVLLAPVGTVAPLSPGWIARAVLVALPFKYFAKNFVYWLAQDTVNSGVKGVALVDKHVNEAYLAVRSFTAKRMVNPTVLTDEELQSINVLILFMVGENEKIYPPYEVLERLNRVNPKIQTKLIAHAGHDLIMAQTQEVDNLIIEFLSRSK